jgi:hypothetical protein
MREIRKFNSCDGIEFSSQMDAARHECDVAIPKILRERMTKVYATEHGQPTPAEKAIIDKLCLAILANRRHARIVRDVCQQYSNSVIFLPLASEYA